MAIMYSAVSKTQQRYTNRITAMDTRDLGGIGGTRSSNNIIEHKVIQDLRAVSGDNT